MSADLMFIDFNSGSERNSVLHVKGFLLKLQHVWGFLFSPRHGTRQL